jgi:formamidopyrimidine-DNA glycosylase
MPELPEVETMRKGIAPILGLRVIDVRAIRGPRRPIAISPGPAALRRRLVGQTVRDIGRVGKRVVVWFTPDQALVLEPRMTGLVLLADPPTADHLRFHVRLERDRPESAPRENTAARRRRAALAAQDLWYWDRRGLGCVRLLDRPAFERVLGPGRIGPDALAITADQLQARLGTSRREVKVALLDQRAVAGIGNLYAAEILHVARISPHAACNRLSTRSWRVLCDAIHAVLDEAIDCEGSTLGDGTYRNALNEPGQYQNHHRVYDREGDRCPRCKKGAIRRVVQAQRATFFCPLCQKGD